MPASFILVMHHYEHSVLVRYVGRMHSMMIIMVKLVTLSSKSARAWRKSCLARLACSEHREMDV